MGLKMFPGMGGLNPKKMQAVMKQMGISQDEIDAVRVIFEKTDGTKMVFESPSVTKINMQGQEMFQVVGDFSEESEEGISEDDVKTVVEKTGCTEDQARKVLEGTKGDLAEAILELSE